MPDSFEEQQTFGKFAVAEARNLPAGSLSPLTAYRLVSYGTVLDGPLCTSSYNEIIAARVPRHTPAERLSVGKRAGVRVGFSFMKTSIGFCLRRIWVAKHPLLPVPETPRAFNTVRRPIDETRIYTRSRPNELFCS